MASEDILSTPASRRTLRLHAEEAGAIRHAARLLRAGGLVAFPTETVYGLGANALDAEAVSHIFQAKERPGWDPLIVHIGSLAMLPQVADLTATESSGQSLDLQGRVHLLAEAFWPGPLTLLLPRARTVPDAVTAGRQRVGVRLPSHAVALALLQETALPIAAPSANRFGHTSPTSATHVLDDLDGRIDAILDGGSAAIGLESTVLDVCETPMRIYRPGGISLSAVRAVAGHAELYQPADQAPVLPLQGLPSPGLDLRHYAPRARLLLVKDQAELLSRTLDSSLDAPVGVMLPDGWDPGAKTLTFAWGRWHQPETLAHNLFAGLRALDAQGVSTILCPLPAESDDLGAALRDRLGKAARSL